MSARDGELVRVAASVPVGEASDPGGRVMALAEPDRVRVGAVRAAVGAVPVVGAGPGHATHKYHRSSSRSCWR